MNQQLYYQTDRRFDEQVCEHGSRREWLFELLKQSGYTHSAFARLCGFSRQTLEKLLLGNGKPSENVARAIETHLNVPHSWWVNPPRDVLTEWIPASRHTRYKRHINCIGEIAVPAPFRKSLGWDYGTDIHIILDKAAERLIIERA